MSKIFTLGDRIRVSNDYHWAQGMTGEIRNGYWTVGDSGTVGVVGENGCGRQLKNAKGEIMTTYMIHFDEECDDGSGDGPYFGGEIEDKYLIKI